MENSNQMLNKVYYHLKDTVTDFNDIEIYKAVDTAVNIIHHEEIQAFLIKSRDGESDYCSQCGRCCEEYNIFLTMDDVDNIGEPSEVEPIGDGLYTFKTKPCRYIASDGRCGIYDKRPQSCRNHPLTNQEQPRIIRDPDCMFCFNFFIDKSMSILTKEDFK